MQRALGDFDAWVSGVRRDQGPTRANTEVVEHHLVNGRPLAKVYPLAYWTRGQIWGYLLDKGIPYNPLLDQGYCEPRLLAVHARDARRRGRARRPRAGSGKTECGLHTFTAIGTSRRRERRMSGMFSTSSWPDCVVGFMIGLTGVGSGALMAPVLLLSAFRPRPSSGSDLLFGLLTKIVGVGSRICRAQDDRLAVGVAHGGRQRARRADRHAHPRALRRCTIDDSHASSASCS